VPAGDAQGHWVLARLVSHSVRARSAARNERQRDSSGVTIVADTIPTRNHWPLSRGPCWSWRTTIVSPPF
jgi:hypothetical protein